MSNKISQSYDPFPFDPKALELARHYLQDEPKYDDDEDAAIALAQHIQRAVEDWFVGAPLWL